MTGDRDCVSQASASQIARSRSDGERTDHNEPCETCQLTRDWHLGIDVRVSNTAYLHLLTICIPINRIPDKTHKLSRPLQKSQERIVVLGAKFKFKKKSGRSFSTSRRSCDPRRDQSPYIPLVSGSIAQCGLAAASR